MKALNYCPQIVRCPFCSETVTFCDDGYCYCNNGDCRMVRFVYTAKTRSIVRVQERGKIE